VDVQVPDASKVLAAGVAAGMNLRKVDGSTVGISIDETTSLKDVDDLFKVRCSNAPLVGLLWVS
jgi:glycine dehydrogenase